MTFWWKFLFLTMNKQAHMYSWLLCIAWWRFISNIGVDPCQFDEFRRLRSKLDQDQYNRRSDGNCVVWPWLHCKNKLICAVDCCAMCDDCLYQNYWCRSMPVHFMQIWLEFRLLGGSKSVENQYQRRYLVVVCDDGMMEFLTSENE